jgi:hypothetical protein
MLNKEAWRKKKKKRHHEGRERRLITWLGTCHGKRQSLILSHLQGSDMSYRFKETKELGAEDKGMHS